MSFSPLRPSWEYSEEGRDQKEPLGQISKDFIAAGVVVGRVRVLTSTGPGLGANDRRERAHSIRDTARTLGKGLFSIQVCCGEALQPGRGLAPAGGQCLRERFYYLWRQKDFCVL